MRPENGAEVLFLRLEGPLMAWGDSARWTVRDTRREPTKSGVVGLLAACLGWAADRGDDARIGALGQSVRLGVRCDRPGSVLRDYHTVVGGVLSAEGKVKLTQSTHLPETVVSERYYLSDACFLVALLGAPEVLDMVQRAVANPVWPPFLGRKCCPPSVPLYPALPGRASRAEGASPEDALAGFPYLGRGDPPQTVRAVIELAPGQRAPGVPQQRRNDVVLSLAARQFGYREVYEREVPVAAPGRVGETATEGEG